MKRTLTILFLAISSWVNSGVVYPKVSLVIHNADTDTVVAHITNMSSEPIEVRGLKIMKLDANITNIFRGNVNCPCSIDCEPTSVRILAWETIEMTWDAKSDTCTPASSGAYIARLMGYDTKLESVFYYPSAGEIFELAP